MKSIQYVHPFARALALFACALFATLAPRAHAQTAPAGNAHPPVQDLSEPPADATRINPFGEIDTSAPVMSDAAKVEFAKNVDVGPLRDLAVFHSGRVKILDTLSREMVGKMTSMRGFHTYLRTPKDGGGEDIIDHKHDTLFTLIDVIIDPAFYFDKPLIGVGYLPMREAILTEEFGDDAGSIERWKRVGRVSPRMVAKHLNTVQDEHMGESAWVDSANRTNHAVDIFMNARQNLLLVPPASFDEPWLHLSQLNSNEPARKAAAELGVAWRAGDAAKANQAIQALAAALPAIHPATYPQGRRSLEAIYNRANLFVWGYWFYALSLIGLLLAFGTGRTSLVRIGTATLVFALLLHAAGFAMRCVIAERFAIQNQFESMTGVSLFGATVGLVLMRFRKQALFGAAAAGLGFIALLAANEARIPGQFIEREAAILNTSALLKYHVTTVLLSYGLITLGFVIALFYLGFEYLGRWKQQAGMSKPAPRDSGSFGGSGVGGRAVLAGAGVGSVAVADPMLEVALNVDSSTAAALPASTARARLLADLDKAHLIILQLAFWTLGVGILLGAWWADHSWGRWWAFDPKEIWALITWIVYLAIIHLRFTPMKNRGLTTAWLSVLGFIAMLWCYFGVNLLLPGLHAYA